MKKRYSIPKEQCVCGITELYDNAAKIMGISSIEKIQYDCRKISITKKVLDCNSPMDENVWFNGLYF